MKIVISIVAWALAGTSPSVICAHELRGGAVVSTQSESVLSSRCRRNQKNTHSFSSACAKVLVGTADSVLPQVLYDGTTSNPNKTKCETIEDYWENNKRACKDKDWYYNSRNRSNDQNNKQCRKWKTSNKEKYRKNCKKALADFFTNYEDAELIFDILTNVRDDEDIQDEDIRDGDSKDDLEETQDE